MREMEEWIDVRYLRKRRNSCRLIRTELHVLNCTLVDSMFSECRLGAPEGERGQIFDILFVHGIVNIV